MRGRRTAWLRCRRDDAGFTAAELSIAMGLFLIVIALITPTYLALNGAAVRTQGQTTDDEALRPALVELSRQVGSANVLFSPCNSYLNTSSGVPACSGNGGFAIYMYDYTGGASAATGRCVQWQVVPVSTGSSRALLQERSWAPGTSASSTVPFTTAAIGVTLVNGSNRYPFTLMPASGGDATDVISLDLLLSAGTNSPTVELKTQVADQGLNAASYTSECGTTTSTVPLS